MNSEIAPVAAWKRIGLILAFVLSVLLSIAVMRLGGAWTPVGGLGTVVASLAFALLSNRWFQRETIRPPMRRYLLRFGLSMSAYVTLMPAAVWSRAHGLTDGPLGVLIGLAPAVAVLCGIASVGFYLAEETDEFARQALVQSLLWGAAGLLGVATVWGFLELFGKLPHVAPWVAVPLFVVIMGLAQVLVARRYR